MADPKLIDRAKRINCKSSQQREVYEFIFDLEDLMNLARAKVAQEFGAPVLKVGVAETNQGFTFTVDIRDVGKTEKVR